VSAKKLDLVHKLIDAFAGEFEPEKHSDDYRDQVMKLIEKKAASKKIECDADDDGETPARVQTDGSAQST
jgi:non-homologous end joining protein Ku